MPTTALKTTVPPNAADPQQVRQSILGIREDLRRLADLIDAIGPSGTTYWNETPSGTINGINTAFTLAHTPASAGNVLLFLNGMLLTSGGDYTISGVNITMITVPIVGDILKATYEAA